MIGAELLSPETLTVGWLIYVPVLIFGVSAVDAARGGPLPAGTPLLILGAITLCAIVVGSIAAAAALRQQD